MLRPRNFKNDSRVGKIGEDSLREKLKKQKLDGKIQFFTDDTAKARSQKEDIDFRSITLDGREITYECKTDAYALSTRNVTYEITSNNYAGCLGRSNADFIWYVFIDEQKKPVEEYLIDLRKWREWIGKNYKKVVPHVNNEFSTLSLFYSGDIGVIQLLCNIDAMKGDGVAKKCK